MKILTTGVNLSANENGIYILVSGYLGPGNESIHLVTSDYKKALDTAQKLLILKNKRYAPGKHKFIEEVMHKSYIIDDDETFEISYGEKITDYWKGSISYIQIVLYKIDKEYIPEWV